MQLKGAGGLKPKDKETKHTQWPECLIGYCWGFLKCPSPPVLLNLIRVILFYWLLALTNYICRFACSLILTSFLLQAVPGQSHCKQAAQPDLMHFGYYVLAFLLLWTLVLPLVSHIITLYTLHASLWGKTGTHKGGERMRPLRCGLTPKHGHLSLLPLTNHPHPPAASKRNNPFYNEHFRYQRHEKVVRENNEPQWMRKRVTVIFFY